MDNEVLKVQEMKMQSDKRDQEEVVDDNYRPRLVPSHPIVTKMHTACSHLATCALLVFCIGVLK